MVSTTSKNIFGLGHSVVSSSHRLLLNLLILCFVIILTIQLFYKSGKCRCYESISDGLKASDNRFKNKKINGAMIYKESRRAHRLLDGLFGLEIGASYHNPFGLNTLNIDYTDNMTVFTEYSVKHKLPVAKVQLVCSGDNLPFTNDSVDFVISSHVIEHFWDPIKTIEEWLRVVKPGGYVYMDIPHKERTFDKPRNRTTLSELLKRYNKPAEEGDRHWSVWITEDVLELARYFNWTVVEWSDQDDKTGVLWYPAIGFTVVLKKDK